MELTKNTKDILIRIYKVYKKRIKEGKSIDESTEFSNNFQYTDDVLSKMNCEDVERALRELQQAEAIKRYTDGEFVLNDLAINYMENQLKGNVEEIVDIVSKFIP